MAFQPDRDQAAVFRHERGPLLVRGGPGTGKTAVLREQFVRLIEGGADPERVCLVVRTKEAQQSARRALLARLRRPLPGVRVMTVNGLAHYTLTRRFEAIGYEQPPQVLTAFDQFAKVKELLSGEDPADWPSYGGMLGLHGFADQIRQFLLRIQEVLVDPKELLARAEKAGAAGWPELADFYRRYLLVLDDMNTLDFAGLVVQAAAAAEATLPEDALFEHLLVDDYQEATLTEEALIVRLGPRSLVVAGDPGSHVFSFQGTTDVPLRRFTSHLPTAREVVLQVRHRAPRGVVVQAWFTPHTSEEHRAVARELRRVHLEEGVAWSELAVVVRRQGAHMTGLLRALDDAGVPRATPGGGQSLAAEPATFPYLMAMRWLARPDERDGSAESLLTSELARLSPASARGLVRAATASGKPAAAALWRDEGLTSGEGEDLAALRAVLAEAESVSGRSALDAFSVLWRKLPYSSRLVGAGETPEGHRALGSVLSFADSVSRAAEGSDRSLQAFLDLLEAGNEGPGPRGPADLDGTGGVRVLTAHATAGLEFDTVVVVGAVEGDFPSLSRPEPMFDLDVLEGRIRQSDRNRLRLRDERRLFDVVVSRARRRVVLTASDPHGEETNLTARSRFAAERGLAWQPAPVAPFADPLSVAEAAASWRRTLADPTARDGDRLASMEGLLALGVDPSRWWFQRDWTDTGRPLHETIRTSYSKLNTLENCALQFVLADELGLEDRAGYHAWVGHTVHRIIEDCEKGLIERTPEALVAAAEARWRPQEFPSFAISEAFRRLVVTKMLPGWYRLYGETPALAFEVEFTFEFDGAVVRGYIDRIGRVDGGGSQITDYKTGRAHDVGHPEENLQLGVYYLAVNRAEELAAYRPVRAVELAFLRERPPRTQASPGPMALAQLPITPKVRDEYEEAMTERLGGLIGTVRDLLETETYRPNPAADCYFCRFKTLCPLFPEGGELFPAVEAAR